MCQPLKAHRAKKKPCRATLSDQKLPVKKVGVNWETGSVVLSLVCKSRGSPAESSRQNHGSLPVSSLHPHVLLMLLGDRKGLFIGKHSLKYLFKPLKDPSDDYNV